MKLDQQIVVAFEGMMNSDQPATHRGQTLKHGTFKERTAYLMNKRAAQYAKNEDIDIDLAYTLHGYVKGGSAHQPISELALDVYMLAIQRWFAAQKGQA